MDKSYKIGDTVQVQYLSDDWFDAVVMKKSVVTPELAEDLRDIYPTMVEGEEFVEVRVSNDERLVPFFPLRDPIRPKP